MEKKVAVICALDTEAEKIIEKSKLISKVVYAKREFLELEFTEKKFKLVLVISGVGKVNAAISTQIMIDKFKPDLIINTGIAGSLDENLDVLDIVVADKLSYHDYDITFGTEFEIGYIRSFGGKYLETKREILDIIRKIPNEFDFKVEIANISSGDQFISCDEKKEFIKNEFNSKAVEMESTAISHVAFDNAVDFLIIRSISDKANSDAVFDFYEFADKASVNTVIILEKFLELFLEKL